MLLYADKGGKMTKIRGGEGEGGASKLKTEIGSFKYLFCLKQDQPQNDRLSPTKVKVSALWDKIELGR